MENRALSIALISLIIIISALTYSYKVRFGKSLEGFEIDINSEDVYNTGSILDNFMKWKNINYPDYNSVIKNFDTIHSSIIDKHAATLGQISKGFQLEFGQAIQDAEIKDLKTRLERVIEEGKQKGLLKTGDVSSSSGKKNRLRHIQSGKVFTTLRPLNNSLTINEVPKFSIVLDLNKGVCIKYIKNILPNENIELTGCDYDSSETSQKFYLSKVMDNNDFNKALHPDYKFYAIPEYNELNKYPYYLVHPADGSASECLTIDDNGISIEACSNKYSQRFTLIE